MVTVGVCSVPNCLRATYRGAVFCDTHEFVAKAETRELEEDLAVVLRLEAEFVDYCRTHGQPNPHQ